MATLLEQLQDVAPEEQAGVLIAYINNQGKFPWQTKVSRDEALAVFKGFSLKEGGTPYRKGINMQQIEAIAKIICDVGKIVCPLIGS